MRKEVAEPRTVFECDGCQYVLGLTAREKQEGVELESLIATLVIPWLGSTEEFHFHATPDRQDCFRYWAHNPCVMQKSLAEREFTDSEIEQFMATFLYRNGAFGPGIAREEV